MTRAGFGKALRLERSILDSIARGMTDVGVGSGALFGEFRISNASQPTRDRFPPMLPATKATEPLDAEAALVCFAEAGLEVSARHEPRSQALPLLSGYARALDDSSRRSIFEASTIACRHPARQPQAGILFCRVLPLTAPRGSFAERQR